MGTGPLGRWQCWAAPKGSWAVFRYPLPFASAARTLQRTCSHPAGPTRVGGDVLFMQETGSGFRKDGLTYEDITQDLPRESSNVPGQDIKKHSSPTA